MDELQNYETVNPPSEPTPENKEEDDIPNWEVHRAEPVYEEPDRAEVNGCAHLLTQLAFTIVGWYPLCTLWWIPAV